MQFGEAVVLRATERPDGAQELELTTVCPAANHERLNVVVGPARVAVPLDRPARGAARQFEVKLGPGSRLTRGDKVAVEFFYPGEQAGVHVGRRPFAQLRLKPTPLRPF